MITKLLKELSQFEGYSSEFQVIYSDIEYAINTLELSRLDLSEVEMLILLVEDSNLFSTVSTGIAILTKIVNSDVSRVHGAFLKIMDNQKFWTVLSFADISIISVKWLSTAKNIHCKRKAKEIKKPTNKKYDKRTIASLLYLYDFLVQVKQLSFRDDGETSEQLEKIAKDETVLLDSSLRVKVMRKLDKLGEEMQIKEEAKDILLRHLKMKIKDTIRPTLEELTNLMHASSKEECLDIKAK